MSNLKALVSELQKQGDKIEDMIKSNEYSPRAAEALRKLKESNAARLAKAKRDYHQAQKNSASNEH